MMQVFDKDLPLGSCGLFIVFHGIIMLYNLHLFNIMLFSMIKRYIKDKEKNIEYKKRKKHLYGLYLVK